MTVDEYEEFVAAHGEKCAICGTGQDVQGFRLAIDHDHVTGKVRGLLCAKCNLGVGYFRDNPQLLEEGAKYLRSHGGEREGQS
jgi:hypothetical protein